MIAIGMSLREARERRGLTFADIEAETRIRARQLHALERERFDELPARAYARAFLREYAEVLGLDSDQFIAEFDARFPVVEEEPIVALGLEPPWRLPRNTAAVATAAIAVVGLALLGWRIERPAAPLLPEAPAPARTTPVHVQTPPKAPQPRRVTPTLVLVAARGACWIEAHEASRAGRLLYRRTLEPGARLRLPAARLWLRLGAPWNLDARMRGKPVALPRRVGNLVVTAKSVRATRA